ncbi:MAG: NusA N-terminal domain-containing protein [Anaerolineae bacterium]
MSTRQAQNITAVIDGTTGLARHLRRKVTRKGAGLAHRSGVDAGEEVVPRYVKLGDMIMVESTPEGFGRIAAQTQKQVILAIREAERGAILTAEREGEIARYVAQDCGGRIAASIDPAMGACVGMRGCAFSRSSLNSAAKIDNRVEPDPGVYIQKALSPARVLTVHPEDPRESKIQR